MPCNYYLIMDIYSKTSVENFGARAHVQKWPTTAKYCRQIWIEHHQIAFCELIVIGICWGKNLLADVMQYRIRGIAPIRLIWPAKNIFEWTDRLRSDQIVKHWQPPICRIKQGIKVSLLKAVALCMYNTPVPGTRYKKIEYRIWYNMRWAAFECFLVPDSHFIIFKNTTATLRFGLRLLRPSHCNP